MAKTHAAFWNVEFDVIDRYVTDSYQEFRTIIAASGHAPPRGSVVICGNSVAAPTGVISALGRVQHYHAVSTARVRVRVDPLYLLHDPINIHELKQRVESYGDYDVARDFREAIDSYTLLPKIFTVGSSEMVLAALRDSSNEAAEIIAILLREIPDLPSLDRLRLQEERDAVTTAVRFAGMSSSAHPRQYSTEHLEAGLAFGLSFNRRYVNDNEDDLLAADLRRFDDTAQLREIAGSMVAVNDRKLRLTIINVNRKRLEQVHGVDLIYYDHITDSAVAVQYKRLKKLDIMLNGRIRSQWVYRDKSQLVKQLNLMRPHTASQALIADDWRLSSSPSFFKFVKGQDFDPNSRALLKGMYIPDEYLRLAIQEEKFHTGRRGGFQIGSMNARYFTSDTFIELVRQHWIGTRRIDRSSLARDAAALAQDNEVVLALRSARVTEYGGDISKRQ